MRNKIAFVLALGLAALSVSACREHPGYPSDHHHGHHHDGDRDGDHHWN